MKTYEEIKDIITNRLGLVDLASYKAYCDRFENPATKRSPTQEEIDLLSPDLIDNPAFWQVADELFKTDPVSNCQFGVPYTVEESNRRNHYLYHSDGHISLLHLMKVLKPHLKPSLLEIGPGYGGFRDYLAANAEVNYYGADVRPRIEGIDKCETNGLLSAETKTRSYDIVVASNVFQHLSVKQRRAYYADIAASLNPGGWFSVSMMYDSGRVHEGRDRNGALWMRHYGQFTEIQRENDIIADLGVQFWVDSKTLNNGYWFSARCYSQRKAVS